MSGGLPDIDQIIDHFYREERGAVLLEHTTGVTARPDGTGVDGYDLQPNHYPSCCSCSERDFVAVDAVINTASMNGNNLQSSCSKTGFLDLGNEVPLNYDPIDVLDLEVDATFIEQLCGTSDLF